MAKGIILRIPVALRKSVASKEIDIPEKLQADLKTQFGNFEIEFYSPDPNIAENYQTRIDSLLNAFMFLLDSYPHTSSWKKETIITCAKAFRKENLSKMSSIRDLQEELERFTGEIINLICMIWSRNETDAVDLLNIAEEHAIMDAGRRDLVTLIKRGETYIILADKVLQPTDARTVAELQQLKDLKYPKTPESFRAFLMDDVFASYLRDPAIPVANIKADFADLLIKWKSYRISPRDLNQIRTGGRLFWFDDDLSPPQQRLIKGLLCNGEVSLAKIIGKLEQFNELLQSIECTEEILTQLKAIPLWYWVLPDHHQFFLQKALSNHETIEDAVSFLSSRHRGTLPVPANFAEHCSYIADANGLRPLSQPRKRSSHVIPRDVIEKKYPDSVLTRHIEGNISVVMAAHQNGIILFQTLISPAPGLPDYALYYKALDAVPAWLAANGKSQFVQTNHALNLVEKCPYTTANIEHCARLIAYARQVPNLPEDVVALIANYEALLNLGIGATIFFDPIKHELFLSSLEQLIILKLGGYSYGSCVSNKDRKVIELIHTTAMMVYRELKGAFLKSDDTAENRSFFVSLVVDIYLSDHHQKFSGDNAPGCNAIKTPDKYFPGDVSLEIKRRTGNDSRLEEDERIANNNKVSEIYIGTRGVIKAFLRLFGVNYLDSKVLSWLLTGHANEQSVRTLCTRAMLLASDLGIDNCRKLYTKLFRIVNNKEPFRPIEQQSTWMPSSMAFALSTVTSIFQPPELPTGIGQIKGVCNVESAGNVIERMGSIFKIVSWRPLSDPSRTEATKAVYKGIQRLLALNESHGPVDDLIKEILASWDAFEPAHCASPEHLETAEQATL